MIIILPRVNNFDSKQKKHGIFIISMPPTPDTVCGEVKG